MRRRSIFLAALILVMALAAGPSRASAQTPYSIHVVFLANAAQCDVMTGSTTSSVVSLPANGSMAAFLCVLVTQGGAPAVSRPITFVVSNGVLGAGTTKTATAVTDAGGHASVEYRGAGGLATTDTAIASSTSLNAAATTSINLSGALGLSPSPTATPTPLPAAATPGQILSGSAPPGGGFSLLVFGGGTSEQLLAASGCPRTSAAFWVTDAQGVFVVYVPGASIAAVNADWNARFASGIPALQPVIGACRSN